MENQEKKQFIVNPEVVTMIDIDSGNHGAKIKNHRGEYLHVDAFSIKLDRYDAKDNKMLEKYFSRKQPIGDIVTFCKDSSDELLDTSEGVLVGTSALTNIKNGKSDTIYDTRYNYESFFTSHRYQLEMISYITKALYNHEAKKFDKRDYENLILNIGLPAEMVENEEKREQVRDLFLGKQFTMEAVIGHEGESEKDFNSLSTIVSFYIKDVYVYAQPVGAMGSLAFTSKGEINQKYSTLITGTPFIVDIGYQTMDTTGYEKMMFLEHLNTTTDKFGMRAIHEKLSRIWGGINPKYNSIAEVRRLDESKAESFEKTANLIKYTEVRSDIERQWKMKIRDFKEEILPAHDNFSNYDNVVFAGGTGIRYYNAVKTDSMFNNKVCLAKAEAIEDENLAAIFAVTEGYYRWTVRKLLKKGVIKNEDFIEVPVKPVIKFDETSEAVSR